MILRAAAVALIASLVAGAFGLAGSELGQLAFFLLVAIALLLFLAGALAD